MTGDSWRFLYLVSVGVILSCKGFTLPPRESSERTAFLGRLGATSDEISLSLHHTAIKTRNITIAIQFYGLLGFEPSVKFRAGPARAAWLEHKLSPGSGGRLELIEVPSHMLNEPEGMKRRAVDLMQRQEALGQNHLAFNVTPSIQSMGFESLSEWIHSLNQRSLASFEKALRIAVEPRQQLIGREVYELAFLYDADGALVELLHRQKELPQQISSGWEPWDGQEFIGQ
jgi:catechol 2,3-dioxygenase-like lactoylglutathione lyase family enzyme